jgi:hypothetical protein
VICTIIAGARRHRLEPWTYQHDVILQLAVDASTERSAGLLRDREAIAHPGHVLSHRLEGSRQKARRGNHRQANGPGST